MRKAETLKQEEDDIIAAEIIEDLVAAACLNKAHSPLSPAKDCY